MIRELKNVKGIIIYHKGCYGCGKTNEKYALLDTYVSRNFVEEKMRGKDIVIPSFQVRRIDYDMKWQDELESAGLSAPAVKIIKNDGEIVWIAYKELEHKIKKERSREK